MNRLLAAAFTAALTTGLLTAGAGTAHAYFAPPVIADQFPLMSSTPLGYANSRHIPLRTSADGTMRVSLDTCRVFVMPHYWMDPSTLPTDPNITFTPSSLYTARVPLDGNSLTWSVPVPAKFQGVKGVRVEVQVGFSGWAGRVWPETGPGGPTDVSVSNVPAWAAKRAKLWEAPLTEFLRRSGADTGVHYQVTATKRMSQPLGATVLVALPNTAAQWEGYQAEDLTLKVTFATGPARRIPLAPFSYNPNSWPVDTMGNPNRCRTGKTLGTVEHHHLIEVVTPMYWREDDVAWGRDDFTPIVPNGLTTVRIG